MKRINIAYTILFTLLLIPFLSAAQKTVFQDTLYYLHDTTKKATLSPTVIIKREGPYKTFVITCGCLKYNNDITFAYSLMANKGMEVKKERLKTLKLVTLPLLISKTKDYTETIGSVSDHLYVFYFIEPKDTDYMMHEVRLMPPFKAKVTN